MVLGYMGVQPRVGAIKLVLVHLGLIIPTLTPHFKVNNPTKRSYIVTTLFGLAEGPLSKKAKKTRRFHPPQPLT